MERSSFDEIMKKRKQAKENGTYVSAYKGKVVQDGVRHTVITKVDPPIRTDIKVPAATSVTAPIKKESSAGNTKTTTRRQAEQNIKNKYGSYEDFLKQAKKGTMPGTLNDAASKTAYEKLISEEEKRITSGSQFYGITNETYQNYLDTFEKNAKDEKQKKWLESQKKNLTDMQDKNVRNAVADYVTGDRNFLEYMKKSDAEYVLKKMGYSESKIKSLADTYKMEQNAKESQSMMERADKLTDAGAFGKVGAQFLGFGAAVSSAPSIILHGLEDVKNGITGEYAPADTNQFMDMSAAFSGRVKENIKKDITGEEEYEKAGKKTPILRKGAGVLYDAATSAAESLLLAPLPGGLAIMSGEAAGDTYRDTFARTGKNSNALATGIVSGAIEAATEHLPLDNLWDIMKNSGKAALRKTMVNILAQSGIEGIEEMTSEALNTLADSIINQTDSNLSRSKESYQAEGKTEKEAWQLAFADAGKQVLNAGLVGALSGGIGAGVASAVSPKMSKNEQKVIDAEMENRIKKAKDEGTKLSAKEKADIREKVAEDLAKGRISIDTIENVLGGETKTAYEELSKESEEFRTLNRIKAGELTGEQSDRLLELKEKNKKKSYESALQEMKEKLSMEVDELTKSDPYIRESYNERERRSKAFEADLSQYKNEYQRKTVENAIGKINNTNLSHDFVDFLGKVAKDKSVVIDLTNNKRLKGTAFEIGGKTVNGYVEGNTITLNTDSNNWMNTIVGHEVLHVLEGTAHFDTLKSALFEYAKTKGEYDSRLGYTKKLYESVKDANVENELAADLVGEYIFGDEKFVKSLSAEQPNVFKRIYGEIKYLLKCATTGSKEERQLLKVKKVFEEVYRENGKTDESKIKYDIKKNKIIDLSEDSELTKRVSGLNGSEKYKEIQKYILDVLSDQPIKLSDGKEAIVDRRDALHIANKSASRKTAQIAKIKEIVEKAELYAEDKNVEHNKFNYFCYYKADVRYRGEEFSVYLNVGKGKNDGSYHVYDITDKIRDTAGRINGLERPKPNEGYALQTVSHTKRIPQNQKNATENSEKTKSKQFKQWFGDWEKNPESASKVVNEDGTPKVMYHGSPAQFTAFSKKKARSSGYYGKGFYFTESKSHAGQYGNLYETYLNIKNPLQADTHNITKEQLRKFVEEVSNNEDYGLDNYGYNATVDSVTESVYGKDDFKMLTDINITSIGDMVEAVELFNRVNGTNYDGIITPTETVAFYPEQIKSATDNIGTFDGNNPDIRYALSNNNNAVKTKGWQVSGKDLAIAPIGENVKRKTNTESVVPDDFPIRKDIAPAQRENKNKNDTFSEVGDALSPNQNVQNELQSEVGNAKSPNPDVQNALPSNVSLSKDSIPQSEENETKSLEKGPFSPVETVKERNQKKLEAYREELKKNEEAMYDTYELYDKEIAKKKKEYQGEQDKSSEKANELLSEISELERKQKTIQAQWELKNSRLKERIERMNTKGFRIAEQRQQKTEEYRTMWEKLLGDTSHWKDKKMGIQYQVNTLKRNLRDIVRGADGKQDLKKADAIYEETQGKYNHNEALLNREANRIKGIFRDMKINKTESIYIQMLGEYRYNPECELSPEEMDEFYKKNEKKIDMEKVELALKEARKTYDSLFERVNTVLREQGMKEIEYRKGYFPHFTEEKQGFLGKLLNWKTQNNDIPTDIAGLTENFKPNRSYQSFNKQRQGDSTDYNFLKGMDMYVNGALDWIYHIEDIQKRRALEDVIRYQHSEKGIREQIDKIRANEEYDAEQTQQMIDAIYANAKNPLNNFVQDLRTGTNILAGKKSTLDRTMEGSTNRKMYSVMTNISNRVSANMVAGSISSAFTNFIPITQSWGLVGPQWTVLAFKDTLRSYVKDDGIVAMSDFLTNRLRQNEDLSQTLWDKAGEKAGILMNVIDNFTSQIVWRSRYLQQMKMGMSEEQAIHNADDFTEGLMAGRNRGNMPTIFHSKNPFTKMFTVFQLEVNNQYHYMFKDMPQEIGNITKRRLISGYAGIFIGAYLYNSLYSALTGRNAAFDPISIIEQFLREAGIIGDDEEEDEDQAQKMANATKNLVGNIVKEIPFVGGMFGGGRLPISAGIPYDNPISAVENTFDVGIDSLLSKIGGEELPESKIEELQNEWKKALFYGVMPMGGGQIKKTMEGLSMFDKDLPVSGSYTNSGKLRFPVADTPKNRVQAAVFGQYANENARAYFDGGHSPLTEKQVEEWKALDIPIADYWKIKEGMKGMTKLKEKGDYIGNLDLPIAKKNILINNVTDRKNPIDMTDYDEFEDWEAFDKYLKQNTYN